MFGAIAGDIIGMPYEFHPVYAYDFPLFCPDCCFTDDTVLSVAVADVVMEDGDYVESFHRYFRLWPTCSYGETFFKWASGGYTSPYNSFGNGSAMRVAPVGWAFDTMEETLQEAKRSAMVTHNHPEGVKGAQATAAAIYLARNGSTKPHIQQHIASHFGYSLNTPLEAIRPNYSFDVTCQGTVPVSIRAFLESQDWEDAVRLAVSMGGDSDTIACITGAIAEAFYGEVPQPIYDQARKILGDVAPSLLSVVDEFTVTFM